MRSLLLLLGTATLIACSPITAPDSNEAIDGGAQADIDATVNCTLTSDCGGTTPICEDMTCQACSSSAECILVQGVDDECSATGACVECTIDEHCTSFSASFCGDDETCRGCEVNDECESGACDLQSGACALAATVVYVTMTGGNDAGICTQGSPCASLSYATGQMTALRNTLVIAAGTYSERLRTPSFPIVRVIGNGAILDGSSVGVQPGDGLFETAFRSHVSVEELEVINSSGHGMYCKGDPDTPGVSSLTLHDVTITGSDSSALTHKDPCDAFLTAVTISANGEANSNDVISWTSSELRIERSEISNNPGTAIGATDTALTIQNSMILNNGSNNYNRILRLTGAMGSSAPIVMRYNTIAFNAPGCVPTVQYQGTSQPVTFDSNIVYHNVVTCSQNVDHNGASLPTNNIIEIPEGQGALPDGNFSGDPGFTDSSNGEFSLQQSSIAIDKGTPANAPSEDYRGNPRPLGSAPDIGAIESF